MLKNVLIVVDDIEKSIEFYRDLFGLQVILKNEGNVILSEGLVLQDADVWGKTLNETSTPFNNMMELYFEDFDIDTLLGVLGLESLQRSWLGDVNTALFSAFVPIIWQNVGYHMLLLYTSINSISKDILEAAKLDGASGVKAARYITIPLVKPMLRTCAIFVVIGSLKAFDMIYVLTNGGPAHMTEVPSSLMFSSIFNLNKYGYGSAISIFIVVECIVMAVILQKVFLVKEESA